MAYGHQLKTTEILDVCPIGFRQGLTQLCNKCVASTKCVIVICDEDDFHGLYLGVSQKKSVLSPFIRTKDTTSIHKKQTRIQNVTIL